MVKSAGMLAREGGVKFVWLACHTLLTGLKMLWLVQPDDTARLEQP